MARVLKGELKFKGCRLVFVTGAVGIDDKLVIYDGDMALCDASYTDFLSKKSREALADKAIELWTRFRAGEVHPDARKVA
ncbi:MAG: hypothetical protein ACYC9V_09705 [Desulfobacteria bacterium]